MPNILFKFFKLLNIFSIELLRRKLVGSLYKELIILNLCVQENIDLNKNNVYLKNCSSFQQLTLPILIYVQVSEFLRIC